MNLLFPPSTVRFELFHHACSGLMRCFSKELQKTTGRQTQWWSRGAASQRNRKLRAASRQKCQVINYSEKIHSLRRRKWQTEVDQKQQFFLPTLLKLKEMSSHCNHCLALVLLKSGFLILFWNSCIHYFAVPLYEIFLPYTALTSHSLTLLRISWLALL